MLDAAHDMVSEAGGLSVSLDRLALDDVCARSGVSRSSAYRAWSSKDEFNLDVLRDLAGPSWQGTAAFDKETIEHASAIVAENLAALSTPAGRWGLVREVVRVAAKRNFIAVGQSTEWRTYVALTATLITFAREDDSVRREVQAALRSSELKFIGMMASFYDDMSVILGFKLRSPHTSWETLAAMGAAVIEGLALRQIIAPDIVNAEVSLEEDSGLKEWSLASLGFMAIVDTLVELDEDYDPQAALAEYLKRLSSRPREV